MMRRTRSALLALSLAIGVPAQGQTPVGLSLRVQGPPAIGVPILVSRRVLVEPFLELSRSAYSSSVDPASDGDLESDESSGSGYSMSPGLGAFWLVGEQSIRGVIGGRLLFSKSSSNQDAENFGSSESYLSRTERTASGWTAGVVAGLEAAVNNRLSLTGEITWLRSSSASQSRSVFSSTSVGTIVSERDSKGVSTDLATQVILRFYPWEPRGN